MKLINELKLIIEGVPEYKRAYLRFVTLLKTFEIDFKSLHNKTKIVDLENFLKGWEVFAKKQSTLAKRIPNIKNDDTENALKLHKEISDNFGRFKLSKDYTEFRKFIFANDKDKIPNFVAFRLVFMKLEKYFDLMRGILKA